MNLVPHLHYHSISDTLPSVVLCRYDSICRYYRYFHLPPLYHSSMTLRYSYAYIHATLPFFLPALYDRSGTLTLHYSLNALMVFMMITCEAILLATKMGSIVPCTIFPPSIFAFYHFAVAIWLLLHTSSPLPNTSFAI